MSLTVKLDDEVKEVMKMAEVMLGYLHGVEEYKFIKGLYFGKTGMKGWKPLGWYNVTSGSELTISE